MSKKRRGQIIFFGAAIIFILGCAALYGIYGNGWPMYKPLSAAEGAAKTVEPVIKKDTVIRKEIRYLCGDKVCTPIPTTTALIGLDFTSLVKKYPPEAGWNIDDSVNNTLILARLEKRVCPYHQDFRHLGISDGFLAVYEGPLRYNQKLLQREDVDINNLPLEMQTDLGMVMDYDNQTPDVQGTLKTSYEFETEAQLNSVLENFDEFKE